jgi:hypothetical protein
VRTLVGGISSQPRQVFGPNAIPQAGSSALALQGLPPYCCPLRYDKLVANFLAMSAVTPEL